MRKPRREQVCKMKWSNPNFLTPKKFLRNNIYDQFGRFLDMLKEIHLSIPFTDVLKQTPNYSKFLEEILSGKRECNEVDSVKVDKML